MNILELLEPGGKTSLIQGKRRVTYSELLGGGLRFGARLLGSGADRGKYVLIFLPMSIELYTAMIGAWSVGAVPIFIDFSRGAGFVNSSVDRLKPDIVVCDRATGFMRSLYPMLRTIEMLRIDKDVPAVGAVDNTAESTADSTLESTADAAPHTGSPPAIEALPPEHPAILTFTSGTTGVPKIAVRSHGFLINQYHVLSRHLDYSADHVDLGTLPVFTLASLAARMTTLLPDKRILAGTDAKRLASTMDKERVTRAICSPALMEKLLRHSRLPSLKSVYLGGAPVYPSLLNKIDKNVDIHIVYGSTEAEPIAGIRWDDVSPEDRRGIAGGAGLPVGEVVPEVDCTLGDDNEIQVSGETVLKGYLDGIGDDENKIREGDESETVWHRTGDAGYFDVYGRLWLLGRVNQAINDDRGTLHPFCVECVLDAQFGIRGAILAIDGERVVVIAKGSANPDDVLQALKHQHIDRVATVKKIPMDKRHDAKIDYPKLLELLKM